MILVIAEQRDGRLNRASWEAIAAAQRWPPARIRSSWRCRAARCRTRPPSWRSRCRRRVDGDPDALAAYTPDAFVAALAASSPRRRRATCASRTPTRRATSPPCWRRGSIGAGHRRDRGQPRDRRHAAVSRPMFQGKLVAEVAAEGPAPHLVSFQIGAFRADAAARGQRRAGHRQAGGDRRRRDAADGRGAVPGGEAGRRSLPGRAHRRRRPRHQGAGARGAGRAAGRRLRRRAGRLAADLRQRLAADGAADRQLRPDGGAEAVRRRSASPARSSTWSA